MSGLEVDLGVTRGTRRRGGIGKFLERWEKN